MATDQSSLIETISALAGLTVAASSLVVSLVALGLTKEQARSYLFPVPAVFADPARHGIVVRNFGVGAMLNVSADAILYSPMDEPVRIYRHIASMGNGDVNMLVSAEILEPMALIAVDVTLKYDNIRRNSMEANFHLSADQLSSLAY